MVPKEATDRGICDPDTGYDKIALLPLNKDLGLFGKYFIDVLSVNHYL